MNQKSNRRFCFFWRSRLLVTFIDGWHALFQTRHAFAVQKPKRLLLSNWASLGDVLLATYVVPAIKRKYPDCTIGFLVSNRGRSALDTCLGIDRIHLSKWPFNAKSSLGKLFQLLAFSWQKRSLVREIALEDYDTFIELYPFFPNAISIAKGAKIPQRLGFDTAGGRALLTHPVTWERDDYLPKCYPSLLKPLGIEDPLTAELLLSHEKPLPDKAPIILHMGSSDAEKELPITFWKALYALLKKEGFSIAFTGTGERQEQLVEAVNPEEEENQCNKLPWKDFVCWLARAPCVITIDSVSAHIAAAAKRPLIVFFLKNPNTVLWKPEGAIAFEHIPDPQEVLRHVMHWEEEGIKHETLDLHSH